MRALALSAGLLLAGCAQTAATTAPASPSAEVIASQVGEKPTPTSPPAGQQWLYGSAEGAIASAQVYRTMADYVRMAAISAAPRRQVVLGRLRLRRVLRQPGARLGAEALLFAGEGDVHVRR